MINYFVVNQIEGEYEVRYFSSYAGKELIIPVANVEMKTLITSLINKIEEEKTPEEQVGLLKEEVELIKIEKIQLEEVKNIAIAEKEEIREKATKYVETLLAIDLSEEKMLELIDIFPSWEIGTLYEENKKVRYNGKLYRVVLEHTSQADWLPSTTLSLFTEIMPPSVIGEWVQPLGDHDSYQIGDKVTFEGSVYTSLIDGNVWSPTANSEGWEKEIVEVAAPDPIEEPGVVPDFVQPTGAQDAYALGERVTFEGKIYESLIDGNTYSPTAYPQGWQLTE